MKYSKSFKDMADIFSFETHEEKIKRIKDDFRASKHVSNSRFDSFFPDNIRKISSRHWTPVEVCLEVVKLLGTSPRMKILDIGSGCGKFCLVSALAFPDLQLTGIEQRPHLVTVAQNLATEFNVTNTNFILGNMMDIVWNEFDEFYLFNPFYENTLMPSDRIDLTIPTSQVLYELYLDTVLEKLKGLKKGSRVVTYHGFGGTFPTEFDLSIKAPCGTSYLELWIKKS